MQLNQGSCVFSCSQCSVNVRECALAAASMSVGVLLRHQNDNIYISGGLQGDMSGGILRSRGLLGSHQSYVTLWRISSANSKY